MKGMTSKTAAILLSLSAACIGIIGLIGWIENIPLLTTVVYNSIAMRFNTAIGLILCGVSIALITWRSKSIFVRYYVTVMAVFLMMICLLIFAEYFFQIDLKIDQYFYVDTISNINPGRVAPPTLFCFFLINFCLILAAQASNISIAKASIKALSSAVVFISFLEFITHFQYLITQYHFWNSEMAIHTSIALMLLGMALLAFIFSYDDITWSLNRYMTLGYIFCLFSLLGSAFLSFHFVMELNQNAKNITQSQLILKEIKEISTSIAELESKDRAYVISGNKQVINNRAEYINLIHKDLAELDNLIPDQTREQNLVIQLKKIQFDDLLITIMNQQGFARAKQFIGSDEDLSLIKQLSLNITQFKDAEQKIFDTLTTHGKNLGVQTFLFLPLSIFFSIVILSIGVFNLNTSINEQRKIESKNLLMAEIVESSNDGIIGKNLDGIITSWNPAAEQIFGYTAKEMLGKSILMLIPADRAKEEDEILEKIKKGQKITHFETVRKTKDNKDIFVSVTISPIHNEKNEIIGASKIVRDINEKIQLENQLRQSQKMEAIGRLTGGVAHDFNNLLGIIFGNVDLLERKLIANPDALKYVKSISKASERGADLTKRLLSFSRMQNLSPTMLNLEDCINNVIEMAARTFGADIKIIKQIDQSLPQVLVDAAGFENALLNVAVNSKDAMPNGGTITISARRKLLDEHYTLVRSGEISPGDYVNISITDSGCGIPQEIKDRIFEPFFTTKPRGKGTGLGLAMVYGFLKQSRGTVRIYSEVGIGTTVSMYLPIDNQAAAKRLETSVTERIDISAFKDSGKVLVVDDEVDLLEIAAVFLRDIGYEVFEATNAVNALSIFNEHPDIKLLITDIIMSGGVNGVELAQKIRNEKPNVRVIYLSGFAADVLNEKNILKLDAPLINKPYMRETFVAMIKKVTELNETNKGL